MVVCGAGGGVVGEGGGGELGLGREGRRRAERVRLVEDEEEAAEKKGSFLPPDRLPMVAAAAAVGGGGFDRGRWGAWCGTGRRGAGSLGRVVRVQSISAAAPEWAGLEPGSVRWESGPAPTVSLPATELRREAPWFSHSLLRHDSCLI